jgi:putative DNA primase/helicase
VPIPQDNPLLDAALAYAARGWPVFPCHTPQSDGHCSCHRTACTSVGKHPRTAHGLHEASIDPGQLVAWWTQWPDANIGLLTGTRSGLGILDEDSYKGGDASRHTLEQTYHPLPRTMMQLTGGGGVHYLFAHPGVPLANRVETLGVGLDIRGDGGYIIAPPSRHASGKIYQWEVAHDPADTPLAPFPAWLYQLCQSPDRPARVPAQEVIPHGHRNDHLFRLGAAMRARGFTTSAIDAALQTINTEQCLPPLVAADVAAIAVSCGRYDQGVSPNGSRPLSLIHISEPTRHRP